MNKVSFLAIILAISFLISDPAIATGSKDPKPPPCKHDCGEGGDSIDLNVDVDIINKDTVIIGGDTTTLNGGDASATGGNATATGGAGGEGGNANADASATIGDVSGGNASATIGDVTGGSAVIEEGAIKNENNSSAESTSSSNSESTSNSSVGDVTNKVVFEAVKPLPSTPFVDTVNTELAYLVQTTSTLEEVDIDFILGYYSQCPMIFYGNEVPEVDNEKIKTGVWPRRKARIGTQFVPHPSFSQGINPSGKPDSIKIMDPGEQKLRCVGIMHARSLSDKEAVNLMELDTATASHAMSVFDGMGEVFLFSNRSVIATPRGAYAKSRALGLGAGIAQILGSRDIGTGTGSGAMNNAVTRPISHIGRTYAVYVDDPNGFDLEREIEPVEEVPKEDESEEVVIKKLLNNEPEEPQTEVVQEKRQSTFQPNKVNPFKE